MEETKKRFDEKFGEIQKYHPAYWEAPDKDGDQRGVPCKITYESENIKVFIESEINLAVSKDRERIVEKIAVYKNKHCLCEWQTCECDRYVWKKELINLINNTKTDKEIEI